MMNTARKFVRQPSAEQLTFAFDDGASARTANVEQVAATARPVQAHVSSPPPVIVNAPAKRVRRLKPPPARTDAQIVATEERRLTVEEAADVLAVSVKTLEAWRRLGKGPMFVKLGRSVRYTMRALDQFTRERTVRNSAEGRLLDARR